MTFFDMQYDECNDEKLYLHLERGYLSGVQKKGEGEQRNEFLVGEV